jgi:hypothetical protein
MRLSQTPDIQSNSALLHCMSLNLAHIVRGARAAANGSLVGNKRRVLEPAQTGFEDRT